MKLPLTLAVLLAAALPGAFGAASLELSQLRDWTIVVAEDALPSEKHAAREFQALLGDATGLALPIQAKPPRPAGNIFIGHSPLMTQSPVGFGVADLGDEGLRIRISQDNMAIAGGRPRGTLYGVYEFMERYLGVRFLTHDHTHLPRQRPERIPCETWQYVPPFNFRWSYYKETSDQPAFAARLRVNTVTREEKLGGVAPQNLISHTLAHLLPVEKYGREHPEYFALVDGERKLKMGGGGPEPCVSNPEVIEIVARNVIQELDQNPGQKNISVSQNDNDAYCRCERCEAINQREGTPMGSHLAFVNAVAERVERKHPQVKIGTLAYWYSRQAPKTIKPRPNVQIQLCSIECSTLQALDDPRCVKNRAFCADMDAWGRVCDDIWIWNYNTNFRYYDLPFPNLRVIGPNVRYFLKNHVKGVFMQANGNGNGGELCDLRNYVLARCLWDPSLDSWELAREFCRLHYGQAAGTLIEYLGYLHDNAERSGFTPTCFPMPFEVGLNPQSAERIFAYFQKALGQAENEAVRARVEKASICAVRAVLEVGGSLELQGDPQPARPEAGGPAIRLGTLRVKYPKQYGDIVGDYLALTKKHGQTRAEEWEPIAHYYQILRKATGEGFPAAQLENGTWRITVVGSDNGKMVELWHQPTQRHLLQPPEFRSLRRLFEYLTLSELGEQGYRQGEPAAFSLAPEGSELALAKTLKDGSKVQRWIGFEPGNPEAIRCRTLLTHQGGDPKTYQLRIHPEFYTGRVTTSHEIIGAYVRHHAEWILFNEGWRAGTGPKRAGLEQAKGGGYAFYNHRDRFGMALAYDPAKVERPGFSWSDTYPQAGLDLYTKPARLKTGESMAFEYQMSYLQQPPR